MTQSTQTETGWHTPSELALAFAFGVLHELHRVEQEAVPSYLLRVARQLQRVLETDLGAGVQEVEYEDLAGRYQIFARRNTLTQDWSVDMETVAVWAVEHLRQSQL